MKTTNQGVIDSIKFIANQDSQKTIVELTMKTHRITPEFVKEFREYISKESFTTSYSLISSVADKFEDLFDDNLFREYIKDNSTISLSMLARYSSILTNNNTDKILEVVRAATKDEINAIAPDIVGIFGDRVDELVLKRIDDYELRENILLSLSLDSDRFLGSSSMKYMSNEMKEGMLGDKDVDPEELFRVISESRDYGWISKLLDRCISGEIELTTVSKSFDNDFIKCLSHFPEDLVLKLLDLKTWIPAAYSYKVMKFILENMDPNEECIIKHIDLFKKAGLIFDIKKYARNNSMESLLKIL